MLGWIPQNGRDYEAFIAEQRIMSEEKRNTNKLHGRQRGDFFCGIDLGVSSTKVVVINRDGLVLGRHHRKSGEDVEAVSRSVLEAALRQAGIDQENITSTFATGRNCRETDLAEETRAEAECHGAGCFFYFPRAITVVNVGCHSFNVMRLDAKGCCLEVELGLESVTPTGIILEEIAEHMDLDMNELDRRARNSKRTVGSGQVVFPLSKIAIENRIQGGVSMNGIVKEAFYTLSNYVVEKAPLEGEVVVTGGVVAQNGFMAELTSEALGRGVLVPLLPQFTAAFGAALLAGGIDVIALTDEYMR
jgi:activator of 2-hydroxyglutaryl-CoA dehydratase